MGILFFLNESLRALALNQTYGTITADIPLMPVPLRDESAMTFQEKPLYTLSGSTTAVVLNTKGDLFFGEMQAFGKEFHNVRNKFVIPQEDGQPQVGKLIETIKSWHYQREREHRIKSDGIVVLLPSSSQPVAIVAQIMHFLRQEGAFEKVILATELM